MPNTHISNIIPHGAENRITSREITSQYGINGSVVREQVNDLRSQLVPVCSDKHGYFIATKPEDVDYTIAQLTSRINNIIRARDGLIKARTVLNENIGTT